MAQIQKDKKWAEEQTCPVCGKKCEFDCITTDSGYTPFIQCEDFVPLKSKRKKIGGCSYREAF